MPQLRGGSAVRFIATGTFVGEQIQYDSAFRLLMAGSRHYRRCRKIPRLVAQNSLAGKKQKLLEFNPRFSRSWRHAVEPARPLHVSC
jgi:hypothetical protein